MKRLEAASEIKSPTTRRLKFQLVFTVIFVAATLFITWLIMADSSPFHGYFLWHTSLPNLWGMTVLIPYVLGALLVGNPHSPSELVVIVFMIIQWFVVGGLLSMPLSKLWLRLHK